MTVKKTFLFLFFISISLSVLGQSATELKRQKAKLTREITALKKEQKLLAGNKRLSLKQIEELNAQIKLREEKIGIISSEVRSLESEIQQNTHTVLSLQEQLNQLKKEYSAMIRFAYRNKNAYNKLMFVFAATSFNQAFMRLKYLQQFSEQLKKQAYKISGTRKQIRNKIVQLDQDKKEKSSLLQSEEIEKVTLSKEKQTEAKELEELNKKEKQVKQQVESRNKALVRLNAAIRTAINREIAAERKRMAEAARLAALKAARARAAEEKRLAAAKKTSPASSSVKTTGSSAANRPAPSVKPASDPAVVKLSSEFSSNRGRLPRPADGPIVSRFGINKYGSVVVQNNGINIKSAPGGSVRAVFSGEVRRILQDISGYILLIRHGEYFSVYSNLASVGVSAGQSVSAGQHLGSIKTDSADGTTQLHFEIWKGSQPTNPELWLRR